MRRETIMLEEDKAAAVSEAIHGHTRTMGIVGAINGRRLVGVVVEVEDEPVAAAVDELTSDEPKKTRGRK